MIGLLELPAVAISRAILVATLINGLRFSQSDKHIDGGRPGSQASPCGGTSVS